MSVPDPELQRRLLTIFEGEAQDHWSAIAAGLRSLETEQDPVRQQQLVETIFREAHTLKGAARLVGEREVEGLCDRLEEIFSGLKTRRAVPDAAQWEHLHGQLTELQQRLGLVAAEPAPTAPTPVARAATPTPAAPVLEGGSREATVRVSAERIDSVLLQAEELLALKAVAEERLARWSEARDDASAWRRRWTRLLPQLTKLRRWLDENPEAPINRELGELLGFLEWNEDYAGRVRTAVEQAGRGERREQNWLGGLVDGLLQDTKELLVTPCSTLLQVFPAFVRQAAASQGKEVEVVLEGAEMGVDRRVLDELRDVLTHLVRNSIDHGIESPAERQQSGKPARATLTLGVREQAGGSVEVIVTDDGRGVDLERVRRLAVQQQLITAAAAEQLGEPETLALLFASGFSTTSPGGSALSGRGLGLAIVKEKVERLGGSVSVEQHSGAGSTFRLVLPITLARFRGIFVRSRGRRFVLPSTYVRQVLRVQPKLLRTIKQQPTLMVANRPVPLVPLADLLRLPSAEPGATPVADFVVVISSGRLQLACRVDDIPYESEIVMKNLGRLLPRVRHIAGATIVGSGQVVPVLNASDLVFSAVQRTASPTVPAAPAPVVSRRRRILVVEDSITSRTLLKSILQGAGFEVRTAVDGIEALTALKYEPSDLVISDVQMPRLDGFELTRRLRSDPNLSTLPVILVTSLASREDKERGVDVGANAYVVKSSFDQSDLLQTVRRLL